MKKELFKQKLEKMGLLKELDKIIYDPSFDNPKTYKRIMRSMPGLNEFEERKKINSKNANSEILLYASEPILTKQQEQHLFKKMNYMKFLSKKLLDSRHITFNKCVRIEILLKKVVLIKQQIASSNIRLTTNITKKIAERQGRLSNFQNMVSEACISCMKAIECFDFSKGNKFSTYAVSAITKNFNKSLTKEDKIKEQFVTGFDEEVFGVYENKELENYENEDRQKLIKKTVQTLLSYLDKRRRKAIEMRFSDDPVKLEVIGDEHGITREGARVMCISALKSMRRIAARLPKNDILKEFIGEQE